MTPAERLIRERIEQDGPISFSTFMDIALYHPEHGYYRTSRDPFGRDGDFYTAEQMQPVFGRIVAETVRPLLAQCGPEAIVVELGAGRREMAFAFREWPYLPIDIDYGKIPDRFTGVVFSNEFFDALPVDVIVRRGSELHEIRVGISSGQLAWIESGPLAGHPRVSRGFLNDGARLEINRAALAWLERIRDSLSAGYVLTIDYGYTAREAVRFPEGTLMSYKRHQATPAVLAGAGTRDITSHVCFTDLIEYGAKIGFETIRFETLAQLAMRAGEQDDFANVLRAPECDEQHLRMQLKTILFGMGESFRVLLQRVRT